MYQSDVDQWGNVIFIKNNFYLSVSNVQLGPRSSRKLDGSIPKRGSKKGSRNILRNQIQFACTTSRKIYQKHEIIAKFTSSWKSNLNLKKFLFEYFEELVPIIVLIYFDFRNIQYSFICIYQKFCHPQNLGDIFLKNAIFCN